MKKLLLLLLVLSACSKEPNACFEPDTYVTINKDHKFTFSNCSENAETYQWQINTPTGMFNSIEQNPTITFGKIGEYPVTLRVDGYGQADQVTKNVVIANQMSLESITICNILCPAQFDSIVIYHSYWGVLGYTRSAGDNQRFTYPDKFYSAHPSTGMLLKIYYKRALKTTYEFNGTIPDGGNVVRITNTVGTVEMSFKFRFN